MSGGLDYNQVFQLQMRETIRAYVRELAGWDKEIARTEHLAAVELIERAKSDVELARALLAAEPRDLDSLLNDPPTKAPPEPGQEGQSQT